ncbi:MAG: HesA/MoeB/ThiF family protein [Firmicutes bacterium]|nr:HesA/MoeB/ThiF family protein [Bacillota bacterium]
MQRYIKNMSMLSAEENKLIRTKKIVVVGCGGIGGYIIEFLARLGVGHLTVIDKDVFEESNLNRQLLSEPSVLGKSKVEVAKERIAVVNPDVTAVPVQTKLDRFNGVDILKGHDLVIDALDNRDSRVDLQIVAEEVGIPMIHGAIAGWFGQVSTIFPGDRTLDLIYRYCSEGEEKSLGNPSFTPALIASIQVSEALKVMIGRGELLRKKLLVIDTLVQSYEVIPLH